MKIVVVGAGVLGASTAYHLARAGAEIVVIDPVRQGRATAAGAGVICPLDFRCHRPGLYGAALAAAQYYPHLIAALAELGGTDTRYRRVGAMSVPADPAALDAVEAVARARRCWRQRAGTGLPCMSRKPR